MDVPFFAPTSHGAISAIASLPEQGEVREPAVAMLPGMHAERIRVGAVKRTAHALAALGQPVITLDYPGSGLAPGASVDPRAATKMLGEAAEWFRVTSGVSTLALSGVCYGGTAGISIAAANPAVRLVVIQGGRLRQRIRKAKSRLRAGVAAVDWLGPRFAEPLTDGDSDEYDPSAWNNDLLAAIGTASGHARLVFLYGSEDTAYEDFLDLTQAQVLPAEALESIEPVVRPDSRMNTIQDVAHASWLQELLVARLSAQGSA